MKLYILRHAESQGNATGNYSTLVADSLSSNGEKQAETLALKLESFAFDKIIVSPRLRALQTISPYLLKTAQKGEIWPELAEACWHEERENPAESWNPIPTKITEEEKLIFSFRDNEAVIPANQETFGEGLCRVYEAFEKIKKSYPQSDQSVLMVTHGHFIREFINIALDTGQTTGHKDNCGMTLLTFDGKWTMHFFNRETC